MLHSSVDLEVQTDLISVCGDQVKLGCNCSIGMLVISSD